MTNYWDISAGNENEKVSINVTIKNILKHLIVTSCMLLLSDVTAVYVQDLFKKFTFTIKFIEEEIGQKGMINMKKGIDYLYVTVSCEHPIFI